MKITTQGQQPQDITRLSIHHPSTWNRKEQKTPRSRLVDSFNFVMGLIEEEPYPLQNEGNSDCKLFKL